VLQRLRTIIAERFMTFEPLGLIMFSLLAGSLFLFISLTGIVIDGETHEFDERILLALRQAGDPSVPIGPYWLTHAVGDITALGGITVLSLMTVLATIYLLLAGNLLKLGVARPRPDIVPHLVNVHDLSFPSGHAMLSAVTYLTLAALLSRAEQYRSTRIFFLATGILLTLLVGLSRLYLGVHYPTDVMAGWCAGAAWAAGCWIVARRYISSRAS
jgi:undecaprenyl-diphosphatase